MKYILTVVVFITLLTWINCELLEAEAESNYTSDTQLYERDVTNTLRKHSIYDFFYPPHLSLEEKLELERSQLHWYPYRKIHYKEVEYILVLDDECRNHSFYDFPYPIFTQEQRLNGAIVLHIVAALYFFSVTAIIINDYFLPSVQCICDDLGLTPDIAAATFMATATTMPEFFANIIATFIAESDMGVGNVVGSIMFNMLIVAATIGFIDTAGGKMHWYQASRDCFMLGIAIVLLIGFGWDGDIEWWEALIMFCVLPFYYLVMFFNERIQRFASKYIEHKWNCCARLDLPKSKPAEIISTITANPDKIGISPGIFIENGMRPSIDDEALKVTRRNTLAQLPDIAPEKHKQRKSLWRIPEGSMGRKIWWAYTWPIKLVLTCIIPSPKTYRKLYPLTFILCIVMIGLNSYMIVWMLTVVGYTFGIPESIMGLTILSYGGCLPEYFAALIMALKGQGGTNYSNSLGTNSLSILFSLSFPWFLMGVINKGRGLNSFVTIGSYGIQYIMLSLLVILFCLYIGLWIAKYCLVVWNGIFYVFVYATFITIAILIEIDVIADSGSLC